jgi:hypothetical protein
MSLKKIERGEIRVIYLNLNNNFGFYRVRPGKEPYICLDTKLLDGSEGVHLTVYRMLLDYHKAIPANSPYRLFPITRYFEELIPLSQKGFTEIMEPEIIIFARAIRR